MKRFLSILVVMTMVLSCVTITNVFAQAGALTLYGTTANEGSPSAVSGTKVLLNIPADGAVFYNNGTQITAEAGIATGTVAVPVNDGMNRYTAVAGGVTYGPVGIYGYRLVYKNIGANIGKGAGDDSVAKSATLWETNPEGITNLIDANHPFALQVASDSDIAHKFSKDMNKKSTLAVGYGFYINGTITSTDTPFRIYNGQRSASSNSVYFSAFVGPDNHLYLRGIGQSDMGDDTGIVITPNVWHDFNIFNSWKDSDLFDVYIDDMLVARVDAKKGTSTDSYYSYPANGGSGKAFIGNGVSGSTFSHFPVKLSSGTTAMAIIRNDTINHPTVSIADGGEVNTVSVSTNIPAELAGASVKIFVNGQEARTMATDNKQIILSDVAIPNAAVTAVMVDFTGEQIIGMKGTAIASEPLTMNIAVQAIEPMLSALTLYDTAGLDFADYPYAVAGNKVIAYTPQVVNMDETTQHVAYFCGDTNVTSGVVAGPFANTVAIPVVEGGTTLSVKVLENATGNVLAESNQITLYAQSLTAGTVSDAFTIRSTPFKNVTDTVTADLSSEDPAAKARAERILEGGRTVYNSTRDAANSGTQIKSYITAKAKKATGHTSEGYTDALEVSYDFYIDEEFVNMEGDANFYIFGINIESSATLGSSGGISRQGTYYKVSKSNMHLIIGNKDTGIVIEPNRWYSATYYIDARSDRIDYYLDGVLITKANALGTVSRDLDKYVVYVLAPYSGSSGAYNHVAYFSNATINSDRRYSYVPSVSVSADDEADILTITRRDLTDDTPVYLYNNGVKGDEPLYFGDSDTIEIPVYGFADLSVAAAQPDGTYIKGIFADDIASDTVSFTDSTIEDVVTGVQFTDTGVTLGLLKSNIPELFRERPVSIITVFADGSINIVPFSFSDGANHESATVEGENIVKVMVWNLGGLRALNEPIYRD